jgi:glycosyltransferase involved in cell wall biosynthesis
MRLAFISLMNDAPWGGSEVLWSQTAALALAEGHQVLITAYEWPTPAPALRRLVAAGAELFYRTAYSPKLHKRVARRIVQVVRPASTELLKLQAYAPDLIFINQGGYSDIIHKEDIWSWLIGGSVPYAIICHLYQDPVKLGEVERAKILAIYQHAQRVFTISQTQTAVLQRQLAAALPNSQVVQNPLNLPAHMPMDYPAPGVPQMAVVASLDTDRKGQDVLFQVLSTPTWSSRTWQLNLYGKGPDQAYLERLADYYQLTGRVVFHGHIADSAEIWRTNHLLVIPSRIESGPMVLVEAMLSGRPVVSTNVGLVKDWLEDERSGFIAEASLPDSLGEALERSWQAQMRWPEMGMQAFKLAADKVQANPAGEMLHLLTQEVVGKPLAKL